VTGGLPAPAELVEGVRLFNAREFFECHEVLEALWLRSDGVERELAQGILQVGVGFYHWRRGNFRGASLCLERGLARLRTLPECPWGLDIGRLVREVVVSQSDLARQGPLGQAQLDQGRIPEIHECMWPQDAKMEG